MDTLPSITVIIPAIGQPFWSHKLEILESNLRHVQQGKWSKVCLRLVQYISTKKMDPELLGLVSRFGFDDVKIIHDQGIVGNFIQRHFHPSKIATDFVLLLLDDVQLQENVDLDKMVHYSKEYHIDILSPAMTRDSKYQYEYMLEVQGDGDGNVIRIEPVCEFFCYLMPSRAYSIYYGFLDENNPWMWGMDLIIHKHMHLRCGIVNHMTMRHYYKGESYIVSRVNPHDQFKAYIRRFGETLQSALIKLDTFEKIQVS